MIRIFVVAGVLFLGAACAAGTPDEAERTEMSEDMEQTAGDERAMEMADAEEGDALVAPNAEEDVAMETEPYRE